MAWSNPKCPVAWVYADGQHELDRKAQTRLSGGVTIVAPPAEMEAAEAGQSFHQGEGSVFV